MKYANKEKAIQEIDEINAKSQSTLPLTLGKEQDKSIYCSNCGHNTLQKRLNCVRHHTTPELHTKDDGGKSRRVGFLLIMSLHCLYKCKMCYAPNYLIYEFTLGDSNIQDFVEFQRQVLEKGNFEDALYSNVYQYPVGNRRQYPNWVIDLPHELMRLLFEIYSAHEKGMQTLSAMGIRTIIDVFAVSKLGDIGGFAKKLKELKKQSHISETQYSVLKVITEVGNAASHRGLSPTKQQVESCIEALEAIFYFESRSDEFSEIGKTVPKRGKF